MEGETRRRGDDDGFAKWSREEEEKKREARMDGGWMDGWRKGACVVFVPEFAMRQHFTVCTFSFFLSLFFVWFAVYDDTFLAVG